MKRKYIVLLTIMSFMIFQSCDKIPNILDNSLTNEEVIAALKEALTIGTDSTVKKVSKIDGYFKDEVIKIFLPEEANIIIDNIEKIGGKKMIDDLVLRINRTAEEAAKDVTPIFVNSITTMTISDGFGILKGEKKDTATLYLKDRTYGSLKTLYQPKINVCLDQELIAGISANKSWETLTKTWNDFVGSFLGQIAGFSNDDKVEIQLDDFLTSKALDGVFYKLALEEEKIRTDPLAQVTELLKKVFGGN
jgi:hypothetical protein